MAGMPGSASRKWLAGAVLWCIGIPLAHALATVAIGATGAEYRTSLQQAQSLVQGCSANAANCDAGRTSPDLLVGPAGGVGRYTVRYGWLRAALEAARTAKPAERGDAMAAAAVRLQREIAALDAPRGPADSRARLAVDAILHQKEFAQVHAGPTLWQRQTARFWNWLDRLLLQAAMASAHRPWLGAAVEWLLLLSCIAGLAAYALQLHRRERQQRARPWGQGSMEAAPAETAWLERAEAAAAQQDWRAAVHALYWASIHSLTYNLARAGRWQQTADSALTPREYLQLLAPGSAQQGALAGLTLLLERVWYARRSAQAQDYAQAMELAGALGVSLPGGRR